MTTPAAPAREAGMRSWANRLLAPLGALMALPLRRQPPPEPQRAIALAEMEAMEKAVANRAKKERLEALMAPPQSPSHPARGAPTGEKKPRGKTRKRSKGSSGTRARKTPSTR